MRVMRVRRVIEVIREIRRSRRATSPPPRAMYKQALRVAIVREGNVTPRTCGRALNYRKPVHRHAHAMITGICQQSSVCQVELPKAWFKVYGLEFTRL